MSEQTAGSMLADLFKARDAGASSEELATMKQQISQQIERQLNDHSTKATVTIDQKFIKAGHKPENTSCDHAHYKFKEHGRYCTCGTIIVDFGD